MKKIPQPQKGQAKVLRVAGIGASAGGLEAFTKLLHHLPRNTGVAYILVQHLDPKHRSHLSELLARVTDVPVHEIVSNEKVKPNHIHVIPPNQELTIHDGILKLTPRGKANGPARCIDRFFSSLAAEQKENALAVVLSGAGSDGAEGLKAVKERGGVTFAQDETAAYTSMPRSAVATGAVDFVLAPGKIAEEIARIVRQPGSFRLRAAANARSRLNALEGKNLRLKKTHFATTPLSTGTEDRHLRKIFVLLRQRTGTDFSYYKPNTIQRRLARRLSHHKIKSLAAYATILKNKPEEMDLLYQDFLIPVTGFFRNPLSFETLKRKVFPKLLQQHKGREPLRFWVAGCSTGQEAYSLAMAYAEFAEKSRTRVPVQIFATDINANVLEKARAGSYSKAQLENVSAKRRKKFFKLEQGLFRVTKPIRDQVVFAQHNLITDPPFTRIDLVSCRNLLIYLDASLQQKILPAFHYALKPDGVLWLGSSESVGQFQNLFHTEKGPHKIYGKKSTANSPRFEGTLRLPAKKKFTGVNAPSAFRNREWNVASFRKEADRLTLARFSPTGVLVDHKFEILEFRGNVSAYLKLPSGKAGFNLLKMARPELASLFQKLITRAGKTKKMVREKGVNFDALKNVTVEVLPLKNSQPRCFLILFEKKFRPVSTGVFRRKTNPSLSETGSRQMAGLKNELVETRGQLQAIQEAHDVAVEELQASNEEVQSSNEELQSLNEELETSNEELESGNEELTTLNEELETRNSELRESEGKLREQADLLDMAPILARSPGDRIVFWSLGAEKMFGFSRDEAVGRNSHRLLRSKFSEPLEKIKSRFKCDGRWEGECTHRRKDGRVLQANCQWVAHYDQQKKLHAVLEVVTDITSRKEAEKALRHTEKFNRMILESSPDCLCVLDAKARLVYINPNGKRLREIDDFKKFEGKPWLNFWEDEHKTAAKKVLQAAREGGVGRFQGFSLTEKNTPKWWDVVMTPIFSEDGKLERFLSVARDITEQKMEALRLQDTARTALARAKITLALAGTGELQPILQEITELLVRHLDGAFARVWILKEKEPVLELKASAGMYRHLDGQHSRIPLGEFKIGRIALSRRPHVTNDVQQDKEISDPAWARREGMQSFAGFPLLVAGKIVGVLALFSRREMPEILLKELSFAADSIAQFVQRQAAEQARREAEENLKLHAEKLEHTVLQRTAHLQETIGDLEAFSYSVSHDLRTPLRAIEGYAEALLEDCAHKLDREHLDYLERIKRGALRLDRLTLDVLAYSRLSRVDFQTEPVDLDRLVHEIIDQYPHLHAAQANIEVESPLLPVMGHPSFLTQCVSNLLTNALKFTARGTEPLIKVWTEKAENKVRLHVRDNGIGIAPQHHHRVFEIFGRIHNETVYEGTGIGLAVVKRAVDRMGGKVGFKSELGKGTCFWIELAATNPT